MSYSWLLHIPLLCLLSWLLWKWVSKTDFRPIFLPALLLKLFCALAVTAIYQYYHGYGDTVFYAEAAKGLADMAYVDPIAYLKVLFGFESPPTGIRFSRDPRAFFFARAISPLAVAGCGLWLMSIYVTLIGLAGIFYLIIILNKRLFLPVSALAFAFLFFPSFVFWSSGLIKESLLIAAIGVSAGVIVLMVTDRFSARSFVFILVLVLTLVFMLYLKYYYSAVLAALALAVGISAWIQRLYRSSVVSISTFLLVLLLGAVSVSFLHPNLNYDRVMEAIQVNHDKSLKKSAPGDAIVLLEPDGSNVLAASAKGLLVGLFAPMPWQANDSFSMIAAIENVLTLLLMLSLFYSFIKRKKEKKTFGEREKLLLLACIIYIMVMATFLALASPNFGTLIRYRTGFQPFFILLLCVGNPYFHKMWNGLTKPAHV